jgi:hypothetical protein
MYKVLWGCSVIVAQNTIVLEVSTARPALLINCYTVISYILAIPYILSLV